MTTSKYFISTIAVFVFIFIYQIVAHGIVLNPIYQETPHVWRSLAELQANMPFNMIFQLAEAAWLSYAFYKFFPAGGIRSGITFGAIIGVLVGMVTASWYFWLPVAPILSWGWFFAWFGEIFGSGIVLGVINRK